MKIDFETVYTSYFSRVKNYMVRLIGEYHAEDAAQEIFGKVHKNLHTLGQEAKLSTWIYRIATNTAIDHTRPLSFKAAMKKEDSPDEKPIVRDQNAWTGKRQSPADHKLIKEEMRACILEFIDRLPPEYKIVLLLKEYEDRKSAEIAEILDLSIHNVKIRLHRAKKMLKRELDRGCTFYHDDENRLLCDRKQPDSNIVLKADRTGVWNPGAGKKTSVQIAGYRRRP